MNADQKLALGFMLMGFSVVGAGGGCLAKKSVELQHCEERRELVGAER